MATAIQEHLGSWTAGAKSFIANRRVLAIVDPAVDASFGIIEALRSLGVATSVTPFMEFAPNPCWETLGTAVAAAESAKVDAILAIGGGTAIDLAKLTAVVLPMSGREILWHAVEAGKEMERRHSDVCLMAIPTTAGTGAEATRFAVLYRDGIKYSISGEGLKPDTYVLDPSLLASLPSSVVADAGLDAACQAMESLWSVRSTGESAEAAWAALDLAIEHLGQAVQSGDEASLAGMLVGSHLAGQAINQTTTTAPHALSYGLTSLLGMPHGRAVALLFGEVFRRTLSLTPNECSHPLGDNFVRRRLSDIASQWGQTRESFPDWWASFLQDQLGICSSIADLEPHQLDQLTASVNAKRLANHPRTFTSHEIREIYENLFEKNPHACP